MTPSRPEALATLSPPTREIASLLFGEDGRASFFSVGVSSLDYHTVVDGKPLVGYSAVKWLSGSEFGTRGFSHLVQSWDLRKTHDAGLVYVERRADSDSVRTGPYTVKVSNLGASYDVPSLVEKLLHQLASKQTIVVNVYDTTNVSAAINMYGPDKTDTGLLHISSLDFGDPARRHEMRCRL
ncbi:CHASE-like protein [Artemisia annua]|uniref:CHASE-like protein n=1 Tax=Artemisia annua TaxID=35608 RepID=A0A2U1MHR4_ARTAN|nr:CHASE-like protein [Artemisia annua]